MNILVIGNEAQKLQCQEKFGAHSHLLAADHQEAKKMFGSAEIVFDFIAADNPKQMEVYCDHLHPITFLNTTTKTLTELSRETNHRLTGTLFGFCGMPTFLGRPLLETSLRSQGDLEKLKEVCISLNTEFVVVDDRVGLVTPRVICMIINEAYYTVQEGTATREDIDLAMKLGTNYPFGPFEWCQKIGVQHVYELLDAMYADTKDERYKISPLLKKEYLMLNKARAL